jgi:hypothetical protein
MKRYIVKAGLNNILCTDNQLHADKLCGAGGYTPKIYKNLGYAKKQADKRNTINGRVVEINSVFLEITRVYGYTEEGKYLIQQILTKGMSEGRFKIYSFTSKGEKCFSTHIANNINSALTYSEALDFIRQQNEVDKMTIPVSRY